MLGQIRCDTEFIVYENPIKEAEKEIQIISPRTDMIEGYNHINSKNEEVTIKTSHK